MVAGQKGNNRIAFIIQARMRSTRLPNKVLMPIPLGSDKPVLKWIADELNKSTFKGTIIVATSKKSENDVLANYCYQNNINCFRGDEDNVLSRFIEILERENFDIIVRLTADNPIIDHSVLDDAIRWHIDQENDYTNTKGLPLGMNLEIISAFALLSLREQCLSAQDEEHVTLFIKNSGLYKTDSFIPSLNVGLKDLRLTIDYPSDYMVVSSILSLMNLNNQYVSKLKIIEEIYVNTPWIFQVNQANFQKQQSMHLEDEILIACDILDKYELTRCAEILKLYNKS